MSDDLQLEKLKIHERLVTLELAIAQHTARVIEITEHLKKMVENHDHIIHGNGDKGLKEKINTLEDCQQRHTWGMRAVWLALIALIGDLIKDLFLKR